MMYHNYYKFQFDGNPVKEILIAHNPIFHGHANRDSKFHGLSHWCPWIFHEAWIGMTITEIRGLSSQLFASFYCLSHGHCENCHWTKTICFHHVVRLHCLSRTSWKSPLCTHLNKTQTSFMYLKTKVITQVHGFCVSLINHGLLCLFHFKHAIKIQVLINSFHSTDNSFTESETCILQKVISFVVN